MTQSGRSSSCWGYRGLGNGKKPGGARGLRPRRLFCEPLEARQLLTATITEYSVISSGTNPAPTSLTAGPDGNIWLNEPAINAIDSFNPSAHYREPRRDRSSEW